MTQSNNSTATEAGRELDALIAEKVMGFRPMEGMLAAYPRHYTNPEMPEHHQETPRFSTDIAAAWTVVEKFIADGWDVCVRRGVDDDGWTANIAREWMPHVSRWRVAEWTESETAPLAICLAALAALKAVESSHV